MTTYPEPLSDEGQAVLDDAVEVYREALGDRLVAAYALGSLAHGGFSPLVSDVDIGLVLTDPVHASDTEAVETVARRLRTRGSDLHRRISVFWATPSTLRGESIGGRFPPLDQLDLLEHGRLLWGRDARAGVPRASHDELVVAGAEFALDYLAGVPRPGAPSGQALASMQLAGSDAVDEIRHAQALLRQGTRRLTKLILFPVRFLYTAATGKVGTNQLAVEHHLATNGAPALRLVEAGLAWRDVPPRDETAAAALLDAEMLPLYMHYIDDHVARLGALGRPDLADAFREWRQLLRT